MNPKNTIVRFEISAVWLFRDLDVGDVFCVGTTLYIKTSAGMAQARGRTLPTEMPDRTEVLIPREIVVKS